MKSLLNSIIRLLFYVQANLRTPTNPEFQFDLYCRWKYLQEEGESIDFSDHVAHFSDDTVTVFTRNLFILYSTITRRAYVLLAAWYRSRGALCCWCRVCFSSTASTWWVWANTCLNLSGFANFPCLIINYISVQIIDLHDISTASFPSCFCLR